MPANSVAVLKALQHLRREVRMAKAGLVSQVSGYGSDPDMRQALLPHWQTVDAGFDSILASLTSAIQAMAPSNAEKVAFANQHLAED